jgi:hypothetical protein
MAEEQVGDDVEIFAQRQILEHGGDAEFKRLAGMSSVTGRPRIRSCRMLGWWTPARTLTSVDLPAPLSPTSATTSPACTSRFDVSQGRDGAEVLGDTSRRLSTGSPLALLGSEA